MTKFTEKEQLAVARSLGSAPALPLVVDYYGRMRKAETLADLLGLLDAYFAKLSTLFTEQETRDREHQRLADDVAAMKRVLGIVADEKGAK